jgi:23S rRNA (uracil1939-C5)-methyltransferase
MTPGDLIDLAVERPVLGGRMLARHAGEVVLVADAIPGERVRARVAGQVRGVWHADVADVLEAGAARRATTVDPRCGGLAYAHIEYEAQRRLKGALIADAFQRIAQIALDAPPLVAASPEAGYRLRARLHVRAGRAGFFRTGTHEICDAASTRQLTSGATDAVQSWIASIGGDARALDAVQVVENVAGTARLLHVEWRADPSGSAHRRAVSGRAGSSDPASSLPPSLTGITMQDGERVRPVAGERFITDTAGELFLGDPPIHPHVRWTRRGTSFFQGNRFLVGALARRVLGLATGDRAVDLYAGVGLFSVTLAAAGREVLAVEGDASSGADLEANARAVGKRLTVQRGSVESAVRARLPRPPDVIVLDPPRAGVSDAAMRGILAWRAPRLVYVSCDPATLARDAAKLIGAGYRLDSIEGFDLFPNTPHIETLAVFVRAAS